MNAICRTIMRIAAMGGVLAASAAHAADLPTTAAGQEFAAWLEVFNDGQSPAVAAFAKQHFPGQSSAGKRWNRVRDQSGGFSVERIEDSSDTKITALLHERGQDRDVRAVMEVQAQAPHRIVQFSLQVVDARTEPHTETAAAPRTPAPPSAAPHDARPAPPRVEVAANPLTPAPVPPMAAPREVPRTTPRTEAAPAPLTPPAAAPGDVPRIAVPVMPAAPAGSEADAIAAIRAEADKEAAAGQFSGAVMIARDGRTVFAAAYGDADRAKHVANTVETRFRIGSMNKMFTATAIMQLVQAGKIKVEDPFGKYIADYPNKAVANTVTIHQLLTHTGGTGDFLGPDYLAHQKELKGLKDYIALFGAREAAFRPGSQFAYSNFGYIILGRVIETVSGRSYDDYVREHIFIPADMTATDSAPEDDAAADLSVGYTMQGVGGLHVNAATMPDRGTPAGGGYSTVDNLVKFADALASHKLLDAQTTAAMTTGKVEMGGANALYGYGFGDITEGSVRHFGHNGGAPGMNGDLSIFPRSGYQVAVLANMDPPSASRLAAFIAAKLPVQ